MLESFSLDNVRRDVEYSVQLCLKANQAVDGRGILLSRFSDWFYVSSSKTDVEVAVVSFIQLRPRQLDC